MATKVNSKSPTIRRILREAQELAEAPSADFTAAPLDSDLFEWHFTLRGPPQTAYAEGLYHGRIVLPPTYPLRPPAFRFVTPSGRFEANREICLSISGHHEETWQPAWGLRTALVALRAFMETDPRGQLGGLDASDAVRRRLAAESSTYRCSTCGRTNAAILAESAAAEAAHRAEKAEQAGQASSAENSPADVVPPELQMVFRDELPSTPTPPTPPPPPPPQQQQPPSPARPAPVQAVVPPTPTTPLPAVAVAAPAVTAPPPAVAVAAALPARRPSDDAVPLWVDRSIVILCVLLVAMLLRMAIA